jgi:hypothetical protein
MGGKSQSNAGNESPQATAGSQSSGGRCQTDRQRWTIVGFAFRSIVREIKRWRLRQRTRRRQTIEIGRGRQRETAIRRRRWRAIPTTVGWRRRHAI